MTAVVSTSKDIGKSRNKCYDFFAHLCDDLLYTTEIIVRSIKMTALPVLKLTFGRFRSSLQYT
jgi:hypothetical protein